MKTLVLGAAAAVVVVLSLFSDLVGAKVSQLQIIGVDLLPAI
jgi:hypothetical protein